MKALYYDDFNEPYSAKNQGQPPPYNTSHPPQDMRPASNMEPHMHGSMGHQMHRGMGQPMHTQHGPMMQPTGMFPSPVIAPILFGNQMGRKPAPVNCPSCQEAIITKVEAKATMRTHMCALMMLMMCCLPCVAIPYCTDTCRNAEHYCPNCNSYIGTYVNY